MTTVYVLKSHSLRINNLPECLDTITRKALPIYFQDEIPDRLLMLIRNLHAEEKGRKRALTHEEKMTLVAAFLEKQPDKAERLAALLKRENNHWRAAVAITTLMAAVLITGMIFVGLASAGVLPGIAAIAFGASEIIQTGIIGSIGLFGLACASYGTANMLTFGVFEQNKIINHVDAFAKKPSTEVSREGIDNTAPAALTAFPNSTPHADSKKSTLSGFLNQLNPFAGCTGQQPSDVRPRSASYKA